ncbi:hypothetical protein [Streptomyces sp. NPDC049040]|uniref:hypothetical protein n=1 Tax=Streptomyces sp. NPDC049040 TaxID=3365593 RepID=UPI003713DCF2
MGRATGPGRPRLAALLPVAGLIAAVTIAVTGGSRTASADPVPAGPDPGRLAYVSSGVHHSLQVVGSEGGLSPQLPQGLAADDCEPSARGDDLLWVSDRSGDGQGIYRRTGGGLVTAVLVRPGWSIISPQLSPDRQWIAFGSLADPNGDRRCAGNRVAPESVSLWVVRTDGTDLTQVAANGGSPDWSPDGRQLAYTDGGVAYTIPVAGGDPQRVSPPGVGAVSMPAWEPDGERIAYVVEDADDDIQELAVAPAGGGGTQTVLAAGEWPGAERDLAWSPDGSQLAFLSGHLYVVDPAESCDGVCEPTPLLPAAVDEGWAFQDVTWYTPADSPPSLLIGRQDTRPAIEGVRAHTPVDRLLLRPAMGDEIDVDEPAYSPDGRQLVFTTHRSLEGENTRLSTLMLGPADRLAEAVPVNTGFGAGQNYGRAAWSPDGRKLAVAHWGNRSDDATSTDASISVFDVSGGAAAARLLYTVPWPATPEGSDYCITDDRDPAWSPDGGRIAFSRYRYCETEIIKLAPAAPSASAAPTPSTDPSASASGAPAAPSASDVPGASAAAGKPASASPSTSAAVPGTSAAAPGTTATGPGRSPARKPVAAPSVAPMLVPDKEFRHIWTVDAIDGSALFDVTAAACGYECGVQDVRPAYRPDGSGVAFTRRGTATPPASSSPSPSGPVDLSRAAAAAPSVAASGYPDSIVLFARTDGAGCRGLVPVSAGCPLVPSVPAPGAPLFNADDAAWSPTGDRLAVDAESWLGDRNGETIAVLDPATGTGEVLPSTHFFAQTKPTWQPTADLTVTIAGPSAPVVTGETADITLHVTNGGIADATGTAADLTLPPGLVAVGDPVPTQGTCTAVGPHCDLGEVAVGQTVDIRVTVRVTAAGTYTVTGHAGSDLIDRNPQDNSASVDVVAADPLKPDPAVTVTVTPPSVLTGDPATVVYTVTNQGNGPATGVTLTMSLPPGVTVASADPVCPEPTCALGDLAPGATTTVTRVVTSATPLSGNAVGTIASVSPDVDATDNTATAPLTVRERPVVTTPPTTPPTTTPPTTTPPAPRRQADPAVGLTLTPPTAYTGGTGSTARITVRNLGRGRATGLTLVLTAPPGVTPDAASPCATAAGCPVADLDPGASATVTVALATPGALTGIVTANLSTTGSDTDLGNDTANATLEVLAPVVVLNPVVGPPGAVTEALGHDFPPGAVLELRWSQGVTVASAPVKVAADGTFSAPVLVLVQDTLGPRQLLVTDRAAVPRFGEVRADYLVVPGVLQPSHFKWRR